MYIWECVGDINGSIRVITFYMLPKQTFSFPDYLENQMKLWPKLERLWNQDGHTSLAVVLFPFFWKRKERLFGILMDVLIAHVLMTPIFRVSELDQRILPLSPFPWRVALPDLRLMKTAAAGDLCGGKKQDEGMCIFRRVHLERAELLWHFHTHRASLGVAGVPRVDSWGMSNMRTEHTSAQRQMPNYFIVSLVDLPSKGFWEPSWSHTLLDIFILHFLFFLSGETPPYLLWGFWGHLSSTASSLLWWRVLCPCLVEGCLFLIKFESSFRTQVDFWGNMGTCWANLSSWVIPWLLFPPSPLFSWTSVLSCALSIFLHNEVEVTQPSCFQ